MKLVLDTDVVVAAMRSPNGASAALVLAALDGRVDLLLSVPLAFEYEATCLLAEHRLASGLSERQIKVFLDGLIAISNEVENHFLWRPQLRDPGDEMVLETAVNGRANAIVTFNLRDYGAAPTRFGISVMRPADVLRSIER